MPWVIRDSDRRTDKMRRAVRLWRYDHSQHLLSMRIGAGVVIVTAILVAAAGLVA